MPRWTSDIGEVEKISKLPDFFGEYGFKNCRVSLTGGVAPIEGLVMSPSFGNNAGVGGGWMYYGSIPIRTPNEVIEVDFLDVEQAEIV